jgi:hypothetical protein
MICGFHSYTRTGLPLGLLDESHLIADKSANKALNDRLLLRHHLRFVVFHHGSGLRIFEQILRIAGQYAELNSVGTAVWAKIWFFFHQYHLGTYYFQRGAFLSMKKFADVGGALQEFECQWRNR